MAKKTLNEQMATFAYNMAIGMTQTQAARNAGYAFPGTEGNRLMRVPEVIERITAEQKKFEVKADMSRQKVIDGLKEAIDIARTMSDPNAMVSGWREIARICGYYAPERKQLDITVSGAVQISQIADMSDEELAKLITDAEFSRVPNEEDVLALASPEETPDNVDA
jgi:phage terminase small subunit